MITRLTAILALAPLAASAGTGTHGGNPITLRNRHLDVAIAHVTKFLTKKSQRLLRFYFENHRDFPAPNTPTAIQETFDAAFSLNIERLISEATYDIRNDRPCFDQDGHTVPLAAKPGKPKEPICINAKMLAEINIGDAELMGLMAHEHIHRLGKQFEDKDHSFAEFVEIDSDRLLKVVDAAEAAERFNPYDSSYSEHIKDFWDQKLRLGSGRAVRYRFWVMPSFVSTFRIKTIIASYPSDDYQDWFGVKGHRFFEVVPASSFDITLDPMELVGRGVSLFPDYGFGRSSRGGSTSPTQYEAIGRLLVQQEGKTLFDSTVRYVQTFYYYFTPSAPLPP